jgi:hypothetical protein
VKPGLNGHLSVQEQAGINTTFPGKSEYMQRYTPAKHKPVASDFLINPTPDLSVHGRPLGKGRYDPNFTEYQTRYEWPSCAKITKLPWLRN